MFKKILDTILEWLDKTFGVKDLSAIDLTAQLEKRAEDTGLNWKVSVVDFLKLIGVDSSAESRAELGRELGIAGTSGDASYNEALRVALFEELRKNGGNVPTSLL